MSYIQTGSGKSREAYQQYPHGYYKMPTSKWWDGYDRHEVVIIDDYRRDLCSFGELLRLFDRYPLLVETKGGTVNFVAKTIVITTPKAPKETWDGRSDEDIKQLLRRIESVRYFPAMFADIEGDGGRDDGVRNVGDVVISNSVFLEDV